MSTMNVFGLWVAWTLETTGAVSADSRSAEISRIPRPSQLIINMPAFIGPMPLVAGPIHLIKVMRRDPENRSVTSR